MTGDEALKMALIAHYEEYYSQYDVPADEKPHRFSLAYRIRKNSIIRLAKKRWERPAPCVPCKPSGILVAERHYIPLKKLAAMIAVIISAVFFTVAASAIYFGARGFIFDVYNTHSDVSVDFSMYDIKDTIEEVYRLPAESGFESINEIITDNYFIVSEYINGDIRINLIQNTKIFAENYIMNTENSDIYEVEVNGSVGFVMTHHIENNADFCDILWIYDGYLFELCGTGIESEKLIELAEIIVSE